MTAALGCLFQAGAVVKRPSARITRAAPRRNFFLGGGGASEPLRRECASRMLRMMPSGAAKFLSVALAPIMQIAEPLRHGLDRGGGGGERSHREDFARPNTRVCVVCVLGKSVTVGTVCGCVGKIATMKVYLTEIYGKHLIRRD